MAAWQKARLTKYPDYPPFWVKTGRPQRFTLREINEAGTAYEGEGRTTDWYVTNLLNPVPDVSFPYARVSQEDVELLADFADQVEDDSRLKNG